MIIKKVYQLRDLAIIPVEEPELDRSLNGTKFNEATGYAPPDWSEQVGVMYENR
jgi:dTDP-4-dehydrorhamnose reductase